MEYARYSFGKTHLPCARGAHADHDEVGAPVVPSPARAWGDRQLPVYRTTQSLLPRVRGPGLTQVDDGLNNVGRCLAGVAENATNATDAQSVHAVGIAPTVYIGTV